MHTLLNTRGVSSGLANLVQKFCHLHAIPSPISRTYDVDERLPLIEWYRILNYLSQYYQKDDLGIEIGKLCEPSDIGIVAYLSMNCETSGEVIALFQRYQRIWYHISQVNIDDNGTEFTFIWKSPTFVQAGQFVKEARFANDVAFSMMMTFINSLVYPQVFHAKRMEFSSPAPSLISYHERFFNCPVIFECALNKVSYAHNMLNLHIHTDSDQVLKRILEKNANYLLRKYPNEISFNELIYRNIVAAIQKNRTDIQYVANQMGLSPRLLQYRLKLNGTTFSDKLNKIRKTLAIQYLEDESLSINEISALLAYREQTSFNRAFKAWTGMSPLQWRHEHQMPQEELAFQI
ncbi:AraC family transcriptional regulator [Acinetobacter ihumii]|uniref:AraC family transcriptional regulator n=1 Tax=Acinetobacter ihumii TaxID=2483802 RepID=UPI0010323EDD|nr:AraC family transcriptional regulator [Acinetobacter ihumii]